MATNGPKLASANETQSGAREQLLEAASEIMREGDTIDLSLSELSLRAGLNSALVKYYFGNKNGLMLALLDRDMGNIVVHLNALVAKDMPPEEKLRRHISGVIDTYYTFPYLNRLMMRMVRDAARRFDAGEAIVINAAACKLYASEMVGRVADRAVQIFGGAGYMAAYPIERIYRDVRLFRIYEGTTQIQQLVIAREMRRAAEG